MAVIQKVETHLNNVDKIKADIKADIEKLFSKLNIKNLVEGGDKTIEILISAIITRIAKKYIKPIFKESKKYTDGIISEGKEKFRS